MKKAIYCTGYKNMVGTLRRAREQRGLDQATLGRLVGRSRQWVSQVECFAIRLDVVQLVTVCRVLRIDAGRLVRRLAKEESSEEDGSFFYLFYDESNQVDPFLGFWKSLALTPAMDKMAS
jgi:transcriptional regulator with XRE-family HTH domain